jgi:glutaredoxin
MVYISKAIFKTNMEIYHIVGSGDCDYTQDAIRLCSWKGLPHTVELYPFNSDDIKILKQKYGRRTIPIVLLKRGRHDPRPVIIGGYSDLQEVVSNNETVVPGGYR